MSPVTIEGIDSLRALVGKTLGPTGWRDVTQEHVTAFARLTGDRQWIHVDVERARRESPFGTTIAHGTLTLAMIDGFRDDLVDLSGLALGVNYGYDRVRFPAPVPTGSRVRARLEVLSVDDAGAGWWRFAERYTVDVEGAAKPACVADSLVHVRPR